MKEANNIPQGYKNSPLGIIPKEWEVKRLGDVCNYVDYRGKSPNKSTKGIFLVTAKNIREGYIDYEVSQEFIPQDEYEETMRRGKAQIGDVLITTEAPLGHVAQIDNPNVALAQRVIKYRGKNDILLNAYLKYFLMSEKFQTILIANATGSTALGIKGSRLHQLPVIIPSIKEQELIISVLHLWDTAIEKQSELIEKLKLRKRALMQQLLTGKKHLPEFSGEWRKRTYSSILTEVKRSLKWDEDELYKLISVRRRSEGLFFRESLYGRDIATKNLRPAKTGDFLISKMQIVHGASGLVTDEFNDAKISGSYISLVSKDSNILDIRYYNLWSQMPIFYHQTFVSSFGVHIEKMTFDLDTFMSFSMPLPPIEEQHAIVSLIESINKEIKLANEKLTNYQTQKRGLMQQLLTGKIRTTNFE